jgi:putative flippase GtrA
MRSFLLFSSVGTIGFLVDAGILFVLIPYFGPYLARVFSFLVAVFVTWLLNRNFTFNSRSHGLSEFKRYFASQSFGAGLNYFVYAIAIFSSQWMGKFPLFALALGSIAGLTVNFILAKKYVFNRMVKEDCKIMGKATIKLWKHYSMPVVLLFSLIIGGVISLKLGQDANWDIKNYHIHNAWAFLNNRIGIDIFPAGIQSYFNPLIDLPYYMVAFEWFPNSPRLVAFLMGLPAGFLLFFVFLCVSEVISSYKMSRYIGLSAIGIVVTIGITGAATISQWGTTFNEIQIAALVVAGLYLIIAKIDLDELNFTSFTVAGFSLGVAAGLKLTAALYAPGAFLVIVLVSLKWKLGAYRVIYFSLGWWLGFLLFYGWWGFRLFDLMGSPMFPMFDGLFDSPLIGPGIGMDSQFLPISFGEILFYPFYWLAPHSMVVLEPTFADPRFAVAYLAILVIGVTYIYYRICKGSYVHSTLTIDLMPRKAAALIIWLVFSYVLWQIMFSILRYAVPIEVFTGLVMLIALLLIARLLDFLKYSWSVILSLIMLGGLSAVYTDYPDWGRVKYGNKVVEIESLALPDNSLVIFSGPPVAYLAPFLNKGKIDVSFIGITAELLSQQDYPLWKKIAERIQKHVGNIYMVERPEQIQMRPLLSLFDLSIDRASCREYKSSIDSPFTFCELQKSVK